MFGLSFGEILIILVVALLVLGPTGMPKLARTLGKGLRDFRRTTGDIRGAFEQEFYKLDQEVEKVAAADTPVSPAAGLETANAAPRFEAPEGVAAQAPAASSALATATPPEAATAPAKTGSDEAR